MRRLQIPVLSHHEGIDERIEESGQRLLMRGLPNLLVKTAVQLGILVLISGQLGFTHRGDRAPQAVKLLGRRPLGGLGRERALQNLSGLEDVYRVRDGE